jgi:hypothetical protein
MRPETIKLLRDTGTVLSAVELGQIVDTDRETVNNWNRRDIITRFAPAGRRLKTRLYSIEEVYKTALMKELMELRIGPSAAREAVNAIWKQWNKKEAPEGWSIYAVLMPSSSALWTAALCSRKNGMGPFYKYKTAKSTDSKTLDEMELPTKPFMTIPISDVFDRVSGKLSELLGETKNHGAKGVP